MSKLKVLELFGGIGACSKALERLGIEYEIADYVEIDKYAVKSFNAIHNTNFEPQDICEWDKNLEVDLIMHGSPCQDFSLAGKQAGGDKDSGTRSSLMYETIRIVEKLKPKYVIWENVKNLLSKKHRHNFDAYLETMNELGYVNYYQVLNAKDYGIPQNRERVFTVSILGNENYEFPKGIENTNKIDRLFNFSARQDCRVVYDENGLCPTLVAGMGAGGGKVPMFIDKGFGFPQPQELKLRLKDMLEDIVDEKYYLNDVQIKRIETTTYNVGKTRIQKKDWCDTLCARDWKEPKCVDVTRKYGVFDTEKSKHQAGSVYDKNGLSPTLDTMQGGWRQPCIEIKCDKPRKDIKELDKCCEYCGKQLERKRFNGRLEDFTVFSNRKYCNRECMRKDWVKIGDNHNQSYSNAHTTARKINELILHKELCELCGGDTNLDIHHIDGNWQNNNLDNLMCLCRSCHTKYERNKNKTELRIRKLTPREVWRLMGFDDKDYEKASKVNSNTQLYKQAGNSIVVNVLEAILKELLLNE